MPTLSASDYTTFIKLQATSLAYQDGKVPTNIQTSNQPFATGSALYAQLLASQAALTVSPLKNTLSRNAYGRVVPYPGYGRVNNPKNLSTVSTSGAGTFPYAPNSKNVGAPPPLPRPHVA